MEARLGARLAETRHRNARLARTVRIALKFRGRAVGFRHVFFEARFGWRRVKEVGVGR